MERRKDSDTTKRYQVFLSYASADKQIADRIANALSKQGVRVWFDAYELQAGDSLAMAIESAISASDYLVVLLSPNSVNSVWVQEELAAALSKDLTNRDITLLPVVIADCEIPPLLASYQYLDLRTDFEQGVSCLVEQIAIVPKIDFSELDWRSFESLIIDLLTKLGFKDIERKWAIADLRRVDFQADYSRLDPFGVEATETWLVEVKFYHRERADLKSIQQLVAYLSMLPTRSKGLLITNGQLTSAARSWLKSAEVESRIEIRVMDGTELKRLLLQHRDLVNRYFAVVAGTRVADFVKPEHETKHKQDLELLEKEDALALIRQAKDQAAPSPFCRSDEKLILKQAGRHSYWLQSLCHCLYEEYEQCCLVPRVPGLPGVVLRLMMPRAIRRCRRKALQRVRQEYLDVAFSRIWDWYLASGTLRHTLTEIARNPGIRYRRMSGAFEENVKQLERVGLVEERKDGRVTITAKLFQAFVCEQSRPPRQYFGKNTGRQYEQG